MNIIISNLFCPSQYILYTDVRVILLKFRLNHDITLFSFKSQLFHHLIKRKEKYPKSSLWYSRFFTIVALPSFTCLYLPLSSYTDQVSFVHNRLLVIPRKGRASSHLWSSAHPSSSLSQEAQAHWYFLCEIFSDPFRQNLPLTSMFSHYTWIILFKKYCT